MPHAAAPTLRFTLRVAEPSGAAVHAIALAAQLQIEPAKRSYDDATRERLVELFGAPERWAATTRSFLWAQVGTVVPAFSGTTEFPLDVACTYDLEVAAAKYVYSLPGRRGAAHVPLQRHDPARRDAGRDGAVELLGLLQAAGADVARADGGATTRAAAGCAWSPRRSTGSPRARPPTGCPATTPRSRSCSMTDLEALVDTLAVGGLRALPLHAGGDQERDADAVRDRLPARVRAPERRDARPDADGVPASTAATAVGDRALPGRHASSCRSRARSRSSSAACAAARGWSSTATGWRCEVVNETEVPDGLDRAGALRHSLLSTHLLARADGGRFTSPLLAQGCDAGQHLARARHGGRRRRAGRRDHAPRPPAARPREPRRPVRLDRDRGGAAAARDGALRRRARAGHRPGRAGDDRARGDARRPRS